MSMKGKISRRQLLKLGGMVLGLPALAAGTGYTWWSNTLTVEHHSRKIWGQREPVCLGILTDLHVPNYRFPLDQLIEAVNAVECDLLLIVGDTIDRKGNERLVPEVFAPLRAKQGKLAVLGNWEYMGNVDIRRLRRLYESVDVELLVNETAAVPLDGLELQVVGLDDYLRGHPDYTLAGRTEGPTIVLSHCPAPADEIAERAKGPVLVLSGHTHGGQIAPFGWVLYLPPGSGRFITGWYELPNEGSLYISPGLGNSGLPFRVGVRPTLAILDIS